MRGLKIISLVIGAVIVGFASFYLTGFFINGNESKGDSIADQVILNSNNSSTDTRPNVNGTENDLTKVNSAGTVEIKTTLLTEKSNRNELVFEVVMNTHSGNLLQYDFSQMANIRFNKENANSGVFEWQSSNQDSHHLKGLLIWNGKLDESYSFIELNLKDIDNIPSRNFIWEKSKVIDEIYKK